MRLPPRREDDDDDSAVAGRIDGSGGTTVVPLGRIVEVFGPVSRPLYSLRLPDPPGEGGG